jgi:hypothetical protein
MRLLLYHIQVEERDTQGVNPLITSYTPSLAHAIPSPRKWKKALPTCTRDISTRLALLTLILIRPSSACLYLQDSALFFFSGLPRVVRWRREAAL